MTGLNGTYEEKLLSLNMLSLEQRQLCGGMIKTYKLLHNFEDIDSSTFFHLSDNHHKCATKHSAVVYENIASSSYGIIKCQYNLNLRSNFLSQGEVSPWNDLSASVNNSVSINDLRIN